MINSRSPFSPHLQWHIFYTGLAVQMFRQGNSAGLRVQIDRVSDLLQFRNPEYDIVFANLDSKVYPTSHLIY